MNLTCKKNQHKNNNQLAMLQVRKVFGQNIEGYRNIL